MHFQKVLIEKKKAMQMSKSMTGFNMIQSGEAMIKGQRK
jgi:hypothetical protein